MSVNPSRSEMRVESRPDAGKVVRGAGERLTVRGYLALAVVCAAVFLTALDQMVVVTALEPMMNDTGVPLTEPQRGAWIVTGYLLGYVIAMPLMGRLSDVYGRRRVFTICLALFAAGSLLCAVAPQLGSPIAPDDTTPGGALLTPLYNGVQWLLGAIGVDTSSVGLDVLVGGRFIQAVGGGALVPVAMAVAGDLFGSTRRGLALGLIGAVTEAGGVLGPLWGAWITTTWDWTLIFTLNLPFAALLFFAGLLALPRRQGVREPVDVLGALLFGAALTALTVGLGAQSSQSGILDITAHSSLNPVLLIVAGVLLLLFVALELRLRFPVVDPRLFRRRAFSAAALLSLLVGIALIIALVDVPLFLFTLQGASPIAAGLALLRMTALIPVGALAGGWLSARFGCPPTAALGSLLTAAGLWLMRLWPATVGEAQVTVATVIAGVGFGLVIAPISTSALNAAPARMAGVASSVVTVLRMSGMTLGLAALTAWGIDRLRTLLAGIPAPGSLGGSSLDAYSHAVADALHQVYSDIFAVTALLAILGVIPALLLWRRREPTGDGDSPVYESYVAPLT